MCTDLYSAAAAGSLPSEETVQLLTEVLYVLPDLGDALLRTIGLVYLRLQIYIACLQHSLDELSLTSAVSGKELRDAGRPVAASRFYQLLSLFDVPDKQAMEKEAEIRQLFLRTVNLLCSETSTLDRTMVLSCLLAEKSRLLCRWFVESLNANDLHCLVSKTAPVQISSILSNFTVSGSRGPDKSDIGISNQSLSVVNTSESKSQERLVDSTVHIPSSIDETGIILDASSSANDDTVHIAALSSTASHHTAWFNLYTMCFDRRIHFLDLFLVCNA